ncbi:MAG: hypothetical protein JJU36_01065 [Phycisphaeraceae bacterium]|nr:hypothetical protein [Phycisphaeraceae bacterium]
MPQRLIAVFITCLIATGCNTTGLGTIRDPATGATYRVATAYQPVVGAYLMASSVTVRDPGDGSEHAAVAMFFRQSGHPQSVALRGGEVRIALYDGDPPPDQPILETRPAKHWVMNFEHLQELGSASQFGWMYQTRLPLDNIPLTSPRVSILAVYWPPDPDAPPLITSPVIINRRY